MRHFSLAALVLALAMSAATLGPLPASAQMTDGVAAPAMPGEMPLPTASPALATEKEGWVQAGRTYIVHNVSKPTLTPFFPPEGKANGTAVVIAPGGGFMMLSITGEGTDVAQWLASKGVTAFVLKYRTMPTPATAAGTMTEIAKMLGGTDPALRQRVFLKGTRMATEDSFAALKLVRSNAAKWKIDPAKIGFMGFSAGAYTTMNVAYTADKEMMPAFIAPIYGPTSAPDKPLPAVLPPMWMAISADDPLVPVTDLSMIPAWRGKGGSVEFHLYEKGGHGYGFAGTPGTTTVEWPGQFLAWLTARGLVSRAP